MLKSLFKLLNKDLTGRTWEREAEHPYFGRMVYYGFQDRDKCYWECELEVDGEPVSVSLNSNMEDLPNDEHVRFVQEVLANPSGTFGAAAPHIGPHYREEFGKDLPEQWQDVLQLDHFVVPQDCDRKNAWELTYGVREDEYSFTCHFSPNSPPIVSISH